MNKHPMSLGYIENNMEKTINPVLSVVIPSYNSECYIRECLESLQSAKSDRVEYILVDGGSTDNTMSIVEDYRDLFSVIISEKDKGQSDAFNKGFALAKGEYLTWLNSDDVFAPEALAYVVNWIQRDRKPWYAANVAYIDKTSKITRCCKSGGYEAFAVQHGLLNVFGPSTIFSRALFEQLKGFREDFHFCMDTEYWFRIATSGVRYERIPVYLWALRLHEAAKTASAITGDFDNRPPRMQEEGALLKEMYCPNRTALKLRLLNIWVRIGRTLNGSYLVALRDTRKFSGCHITELTSR